MVSYYWNAFARFLFLWVLILVLVDDGLVQQEKKHEDA